MLRYKAYPYLICERQPAFVAVAIRYFFGPYPGRLGKGHMSPGLLQGRVNQAVGSLGVRGLSRLNSGEKYRVVRLSRLATWRAP